MSERNAVINPTSIPLFMGGVIHGQAESGWCQGVECKMRIPAVMTHIPVVSELSDEQDISVIPG